MKVVENINKTWHVNMEDVDPDNYPSVFDITLKGVHFDNKTYDVTFTIKEDGWIKESKNFTKGKRQINNALKIFGLSI